MFNREITFACGNNEADKNPTNVTCTVWGLFKKLEQYRQGAKDGPYILQGGVAPGGERADDTMDRQDILTFDVENGASQADVADILRRAGFLAAIYPTNSHMTTQTRISGRDLPSADATPAEAWSGCAPKSIGRTGFSSQSRKSTIDAALMRSRRSSSTMHPCRGYVSC